MNIYEKLQSARMELQATEIKKTGYNSFSKYYYMELADFLMPTQELFQKHKLCGIVSFTADLATLTIVDMEDVAMKIVITSPMGSADLKACHEVQNIGAVETYQRRYLWGTAMEIVEHDAIDSADNTEKPAKQVKQDAKPAAKEAPISESKLADLMAVLDAAETSEELKEVFAAAWKESKGHATIKNHYDSLKGKFA